MNSIHFIRFILISGVISFLHSPLQAQRLLDPYASGGPISIVTASSGGSNSSVAVAYSLRALKTSYDHAAITPPASVSGFTNSTTPLIRVRRSSDDNQLDIGYDVNGILDTVTMKTFVGSGSGYVSVWYDQSGNSKDALQATTSLQHRIVNAGVMDVNESGVPMMVATNGSYLSEGGTAADAPNGINRYGILGERTMIVTCQPKAYSNGTLGGGGGAYAIDRNGTTGIQSEPLTNIKIVSDKWSLEVRNNLVDISQSFIGSIPVSTTRTDVVTVMRSGDTYSLEVDGAIAGTSTLMWGNSMSPLVIGSGLGSGEFMYMGDVLLFGSALSVANRDVINASMNSWFSIGDTYTWIGTSSTAWNNTANWLNNKIPEATSNVVIPNGTPYTTYIPAAQTYNIRKLTINTGASITLEGTLKVSDSVTVNGSITSTGTLELSGTYTQYVSGAINNLNNNNTTATVYAAGNITTGSSFTNASGATLDLKTFTLSAASATITNNGTLKTANTGGTPLPTGKTWGGTVMYNAASGTQTVMQGTYNNLTMGNTSGTQTATGNIVVNGTLTTTAGGTLSFATGTLSGTLGTITNNGTLTTANTSATPFPSGRTWGGTVVYNATTGSQTVMQGTYNNLTMNNTSGTQTVSGNITVNGTLTTTAGGTFNLSIRELLGTLTTINHDGTMTTGCGSNPPIPVGKTWNGTVIYTSTTGGQRVSSGTYNNLTVLNSSGTQIATGNLVVNGTLTTTAGGTLSFATGTLSGTLSTIANNGILTYANTSATPFPSGRTWGGTVVYNAATGSQTVMQGTYNNLTMGNTSGTQTVSGNITVNGTLTTTAGGTFNLSIRELLGTLTTINHDGTMTTGCGSNPPIPVGKTWNGTITYTSTIGGQRVSSGTYNNLTVLNSSGTQTLTGNVTVNGVLTTTSGGKLALGANTLTINGTLSGITASSSFTANGSSSIVINGSGAIGSSLFFDQTTPGTTNRLNNLTYNRSSQTITLGNALQVAGTVTPTAGTLATGGFLTLVSNATGTARIAAGSGSYITGNVTAERYIPSVARRWRFLASPVSGSTLADWKNEIYITGEGGTSNGFDQTTSNQPGVYYYDESLQGGYNAAGWLPATTINTALTMGKGFRVFIRGDRSDAGVLTGSTGTQAAVTMNAIGAVNSGNITMPVSYTNYNDNVNDGWSLMGNPYPSPIDWNAFHDAGRSGSSPDYSGTDYAHLDAVTSVYDANTANYVSYNAVSNIGTGSLSNGIIPSGASFWVKASASSPSMTMKEVYKTGSTPAAMFKSEPPLPAFSLKLIKDEITSDEMVIKYMAEAAAESDQYDIAKRNGEVNICSVTPGGAMLTGNCKPFNGRSDSIMLNVAGESGNYTISASHIEMLAPGHPVYLIDAFAHTATDLNSTTTYNFSIDKSNSSSFGKGRFMIVVGDFMPATAVAEEKMINQKLTLDPVFTDDEVTISNTRVSGEKAIITISDTSGKQVASFNNLVWNNGKITLSLSEYKAGAYFISINTGTQSVVLKCVKGQR